MKRLGLLALAWLGCWGGGEGTGRVSALDGKTVVGSLDERGLQALCAEIDHWNEANFGSAAFRRNQCEIRAAVALRNGQPFTGDAQAACRASATSCEVMGRDQPSIMPRCQRWTGPCPLTVAELEQCLTDLAYNLFGLLVSAPACDDICADVHPLTLDAASCANVRAGCLGFAFTRPDFQDLEQVPPCR